MTLERLLLEIGNIGINDKLINYAAAGSSIYSLNAMTIRNYPILYVSPTGTHTVTENLTTYALTLFYIDRLVEDSTNDVDIHSAGIEVLKNIIRKIDFLEGVVDVDNTYSIQLFTETEKMSDRCNGAFAQINVTIQNETICGIN